MTISSIRENTLEPSRSNFSSDISSLFNKYNVMKERKRKKMEFKWKGLNLGDTFVNRKSCLWIGPEQTGDMYLSLLAALSCACTGIPSLAGLQSFYAFTHVVAVEAIKTVVDKNNPYECSSAVWKVLRDQLQCSLKKGQATEPYEYKTQAYNFITDILTTGRVNCAGGSTLLVHVMLTLRPDWKDQIGYVMRPGHVFVWALDTTRGTIRGIDTVKRRYERDKRFNLVSQANLSLVLDPQDNTNVDLEDINMVRDLDRSEEPLIAPAWVGDIRRILQMFSHSLCSRHQLELLSQLLPNQKVKTEYSDHWQPIVDYMKIVGRKGSDHPESQEQAKVVASQLFPNKVMWQPLIKSNMLDTKAVVSQMKNDLLNETERMTKMRHDQEEKWKTEIKHRYQVLKDGLLTLDFCREDLTTDARKEMLLQYLQSVPFVKSEKLNKTVNLLLEFCSNPDYGNDLGSYIWDFLDFVYK
jgi:hypothetical protein